MSKRCEVKGRVCEVRLGQKGGNSYGNGGKGMRSLQSRNFSNPRTSRDWLQLESLDIADASSYTQIKLHGSLRSFIISGPNGCRMILYYMTKKFASLRYFCTCFMHDIEEVFDRL